MNDWLAAAPNATVAHTAVGCMVSVNDLADRPPRPLEPGEVIDLGGKRVRHLATPHVPHGWDAGGATSRRPPARCSAATCSPRSAPSPALTTDDIVGPAVAAEDVFLATCLTPATAPTIRSLADLAPRTLALMHGPSFNGDTVAALGDARRRLRGAAPCRDGRGRVSVAVWRTRSTNCQILLRAGVDRCRSEQVPYVVAVTGSVAVGKSATAQVLRESLERRTPTALASSRVVRRLPVPQPGARRARAHHAQGLPGELRP